MKQKTLLAAVLVVLSTPAQPLFAAEEFGTVKEAEALVKKAVEHIHKAGNEQAYADFTGKKAPFVDRDLYITVMTLSGMNLAHGANPKIVGKDMLDFKDIDGKPFLRERMDLARTKGKFWQDFKYSDPTTKKILPKSGYCERDNDIVVCTGIYKR
jgi:signal transduction histidine kinase